MAGSSDKFTSKPGQRPDPGSKMPVVRVGLEDIAASEEVQHRVSTVLVDAMMAGFLGSSGVNKADPAEPISTEELLALLEDSESARDRAFLMTIDRTIEELNSTSEMIASLVRELKGET